MEEVKICHDKIGNTLIVWFGNPEDEYISEETGDDMVLMKDKSGKVIGFEKWNLSHFPEKNIKIPLESIS
jgi:hypothetical protein